MRDTLSSPSVLSYNNNITELLKLFTAHAAATARRRLYHTFAPLSVQKGVFTKEYHLSQALHHDEPQILVCCTTSDDQYQGSYPLLKFLRPPKPRWTPARSRGHPRTMVANFAPRQFVWGCQRSKEHLKDLRVR